MQDQAIIDLICEGDELGFVSLADKYERLLFHIAKGILGNRSRDIEECINDTYLKLWNNIEQFDMNKASLKTYLKVIIRNTAINKLRDLSRHEKNQLPDDITDIAKYYADQSQSVEKEVFGKESIEQLNDLIRNLKERDRELIIRKYFYLQSSKHMASAMNMTVTAIDSRISRLRKKIKQDFEKLDKGEAYITEIERIII